MTPDTSPLAWNWEKSAAIVLDDLLVEVRKLPLADRAGALLRAERWAREVSYHPDRWALQLHAGAAMWRDLTMLLAGVNIVLGAVSPGGQTSTTIWHRLGDPGPRRVSRG